MWDFFQNNAYMYKLLSRLMFQGKGFIIATWLIFAERQVAVNFFFFKIRVTCVNGRHCNYYDYKGVFYWAINFIPRKSLQLSLPPSNLIKGHIRHLLVFQRCKESTTTLFPFGWTVKLADF